MVRTAYSTVACPDQSLTRVAEDAANWGYAGVELRSFGHGGTEFVCDPGLTDKHKVRRTFHRQGVDIAGIASGVRFDAPVFPPVIGLLGYGYEAPVREAKHYVDIAEDVGAEYVRVYAFEAQGRESRKPALRRICDRLARACDHARNRGVRFVIENGGSFPFADDLAEILSRVNSPLLGACYDLSVAARFGEDPIAGAQMLGRSLTVARVKDGQKDRCVPLGLGDLPCHEFVRTVASVSPDAWVVFSWDRAWLPELAPCEQVLPEAASLIDDWIREAQPPASTAAA